MHWHILPATPDTFIAPTNGVDPATGRVVDDDALGWDLYAQEDGEIPPLQRRVINLGFASEFTRGYGVRYCDRSGLAAKKGITYFGGLMESSYRGPWLVTLYNSTSEHFAYKRGDRIIQAVFFQKVHTDVTIVTSLSESVRGTGGLGSSGR